MRKSAAKLERKRVLDGWDRWENNIKMNLM
jgi:hypothetical protein